MLWIAEEDKSRSIGAGFIRNGVHGEVNDSMINRLLERRFRSLVTEEQGIRSVWQCRRGVNRLVP